jgi:sugar O-acyltransferase (sialic acid O-acetyltransferase NeuD family)
MIRPLIILGTGGNALDVLDTVDALNAVSPMWEVAGFLDDARPPGSPHSGLKVLGGVRDASKFNDALFMNAIGSDKSYRSRPEILDATGLQPDQFATLIHPGASVSPRACVGRGVHVNYGVSVGGRVVLGDHTTLGPNCTLGHDAVVEDYAIIAPGAVISGFVRVGRGCYVGAASSIRQRVCIGAQALVGIGAVVLCDVGEGVTVVGNPARPLIRSNGEGTS